MQSFWIFTYIAAVVLTANGHVQDLRVDVTPVQTRFSAAQGVNVILKYSNTGDDAMSIYKWCLPEQGLFDPIFELTRDGKPVEYVGPLVKRRTPTAEDLISVAPGTTVRAVIKLSSVYNMTQSGNYVIQYKIKADQVLFSTESTLKRRIASSSDDSEFVIQSAPVVVFAVGHRNLLVEQATEAGARTRMLSPTYLSCSSSQASSINSGMRAAQSYASNAIQHLNGGTGATQRYAAWFGQYSSSNLNTLKSKFTKIESALDSKALSFDCSCPAAGPGTYAYVYASQHYRIYLCSEFWRSSVTGTDSMGGTIIHELAHFSILAGTGDHAYGQSDARSLAQSNPAMALVNSDSLQYFAENNPQMS